MDFSRADRLAAVLAQSNGIRVVPDNVLIPNLNMHLKRLGAYSPLGSNEVSNIEDAAAVLDSINFGFSPRPQIWQKAHSQVMTMADRMVDASKEAQEAIGRYEPPVTRAASLALESINRGKIQGPFGAGSDEAVYETIGGFLGLALMLAFFMDNEVNPYEPLVSMARDGAFLCCIKDDFSAGVWRRQSQGRSA